MPCLPALQLKLCMITLLSFFFSLNRPELLKLDAWPRLCLDGNLGLSPFRSVDAPHSEIQESKVIELDGQKDKVKVELIKYEENIRIKHNIECGKCEDKNRKQGDKTRRGENSSTSARRVSIAFRFL